MQGGRWGRKGGVAASGTEAAQARQQGGPGGGTVEESTVLTRHATLVFIHLRTV